MFKKKKLFTSISLELAGSPERTPYVNQCFKSGESSQVSTITFSQGPKRDDEVSKAEDKNFLCDSIVFIFFYCRFFLHFSNVICFAVINKNTKENFAIRITLKWNKDKMA